MKKYLAAALILAMTPFAASARDSLGSYTYVEAGYNRLSVKNLAKNTLDFDGAYVGGSVELSDNLYVHGGLAWTQNSDLPKNIDAREGHIGLGYKYNFADNVDLIVEGSFQRQNFSSSGANGSDTKNNTRLGVGVRGALSNSIEGWVKANYVDGGAYRGGKATGTLGAQFVFNERWGIVGEIDAGGGNSRYTLGVRASF